jgi:transcriptional regulator with XRE-family HTH domain
MLETSKVAQLIEIKGFRRSWLAKKCGISVDTLNRALKGRRKLGLSVVMHLANLLETTVGDISEYQTEVKAAS